MYVYIHQQFSVWDCTATEVDAVCTHQQRIFLSPLSGTRPTGR